MGVFLRTKMLIEEEEQQQQEQQQQIVNTNDSETPVNAGNSNSKLVTEIKTARGIVKLPSLFEACKNGHLPIVRYYIENDPSINIDAVDENGGTLLHWAAYKGYSDIVVYLISKGADVDSLSVPSKQ